MACKIVAMGFSGHADSYLADTWNRLDFSIVVHMHIHVHMHVHMHIYICMDTWNRLDFSIVVL